MHDTPAEMAQPIKDWAKGECEPIPGKTMPRLAVVERDYVNLYNRFVSLGPDVRRDGHRRPRHHAGRSTTSTTSWSRDRPGRGVGRQRYPSLEDAEDAANVILTSRRRPTARSAYRAFEAEEKKTGLPLPTWPQATRGVRYTFDDLQPQPRRLLTSPFWIGHHQRGAAPTRPTA